MKKTVLLTLFLSFMGLFANAQCTYLNEDFEDWSTLTLEFQGVERDVMTPDNHVSYLRFFVNFLLIELFNDPDAFDLFQNDPQGFWGISQSTDATSGDYAVKLQGDDNLTLTDIYTNFACTEIHKTLQIDIKHVGSSADTLYIFGAYDENLPPVPDDPAALDTLAGYFLDSLFLTGDSAYTTYTFQVHINDPDAPVDSFSLIVYGTTGTGSYFLIDNIRLFTPVDNDNDGYTADVDCDDNNPDVNPGATEVCNFIDDNCDGEVDEGFPTVTYYADSDGDGYGDPAASLDACDQPLGYVENSDDCDDTNPDVNPDATEVCNFIDDNCDGKVDEGFDTETYYLDSDGDGFGDPNSSVEACDIPAGYVDNNGDCDDTNPDVNPNGIEICNGVDDDCNGIYDDGFPTSTFYADTDGDGFGDAAAPVEACDIPAGYVANDEDCDDTNADVNPDATEVCNFIDDNCDGQIDEGFATDIYYADTDGDGFGDAGASVEACDIPPGYVTNADDCDDTNADVNPDATEVCNFIDDNCDGEIDEGFATDTYYVDSDGDGYGDAAESVVACAAPAGYVENADDCDDTNADVNPGATEVCNFIDDNCDGEVDEGFATDTYYADTDGDGYGDAAATVEACMAPPGYVDNADDCDDTNADVNPGATEVCNGIDDNCDGQVDEGVLNTYYADTDGDGYGDAADSVEDCTAPTGYVDNADDCDDTNADVNPGATEVCNGIDDNCDGQIDEGVLNTYYADTDGDSYGDPNSTVEACDLPAGYVEFAGDCDDTNAAVNIEAIEVCNGIDDNCDGQIDEGLLTTYYADLDGDGYGDAAASVEACDLPIGYVENSDDCDDANADVNPGATEVCNFIDDNCNGEIDEGFPTDTYYADTDGDGYGDANSSVVACAAPAGYVDNADDCDDTNADVNPGATEVCNFIDDNCDGEIDEGFPTDIFYADSDGDGYGDAAESVIACVAPAGYVDNADDCDDTNADVNPGATEVCNFIDDNCDGEVDEGFPTDTYYGDNDGDGYGDAEESVIACAAPAGYVDNADDCDDTNADVNPGATEVCNKIDDNCDGEIDEGLLISTYYLDADGDGYGNAAVSEDDCAAPAGYVDNADDCDDTNADVNPGATEVCNDVDDNCDGEIDEGLPINTYYFDLDGDGYGDAAESIDACGAPVGYVDNADDCNDNDANEFPGQTWYADTDGDGYGDGSTQTDCLRPADHFLESELIATTGDCDADNADVYPGATEVCNGIDDNCDGEVDESLLNTYYFDADGDGFGGTSMIQMACTAPVGYVPNSDDCDDNDAAVNPGAIEVCNGIDDNCDGEVDEGVLNTYYLDADGDGYGNAATSIEACDAPADYVVNSNDCDDSNAAVFPDADEVCNGIDDNCDGQIDEGLLNTYYLDSDGDGFGNAAMTVQACSAPANYVSNSTDCNDGNAAVFPGATEVCNGLDDNCDSQIDEGLLNTYYLDSDGDGFGNAAMTVQACSAPANYVSNSTDCNDNNAAVFPGATEVCNGIDDNCNSQVDEGVLLTFYQDSDGDGFGNAAITQQDCMAPTGYVADNTDCDDSNPNAYPGATEIANNGIDEDCDGSDLMTSTDELAALNIRVYPNPFSDVLRLENVPATGFEVKLVNIFGQVMSDAVQVNNTRIDSSRLPAGTYFVHITEVDTARRKVVMVMKQ